MAVAGLPVQDAGMVRGFAAGMVWTWGLWAAGSTLEFLAVAPMWPFVLAGVGIAAVIIISPLRASDRGAQRATARRV